MTVQKICRSSRDEDEVREVLAKVWDEPKNAESIVAALAEKNQDIYQSESTVESSEEHRGQLMESDF